MRTTRTNSTSAVVVLTLATLLGACASNRPVAQQLDDAAIATKVEAKLAADPQVSNFRVDVDVREGVVRLSGLVEKPEARQEAEELARRTDGVRDVINEIEIGKRSIGDRFDDATVTTKVKAKLAADPEINPFSIDVDTIDGVVTLTGRVEDERRRQEAEELARSTKGVRDVRNLLEVGDVGEADAGL